LSRFTTPSRSGGADTALPNFICPGAAKCGTTSLYGILAGHPQIFLSKVNKEAHFFDYDDNYARGLDWYRRTFFREYAGQPVVGDITPSYMFVPQAFGRIRRDLGSGVRFVFLLRDPAARAFSHHQFNVRRGYEDLPFADALAAEAERTARDFFSLLHFSYAGRGRYAGQLAGFLRHFGRERMLVLLFEEDFVAHREAAVRRVETFLGVEHAALDLGRHANASAVSRSPAVSRLLFGNRPLRRFGKALLPSYKMRRGLFRQVKRLLEKPAAAARLDEDLKRKVFERYFRDDVERLENLLGRDLAQWKA
jgi:hypothetical protein